ncbi:MAG: peptide-methionine (S)-S-oxide reductase, partial [Eubacterium sp.]|nr:peptide-methionine (S)-S-oxide reductase [Eubacterium sp.]
TGIFYTEKEQIKEIERVYACEESKAGQPLAVIVEPLKSFFSAEEYHQKYLEKNPDGYCHIPKDYFSHK